MRTRERAVLRYRHRWRLGDLLQRNNRSTVHQRDLFDNAHVPHADQGQGRAARMGGSNAIHSAVTLVVIIDQRRYCLCQGVNVT